MTSFDEGIDPEEYGEDTESESDLERTHAQGRSDALSSSDEADSGDEPGAP